MGDKARTSRLDLDCRSQGDRDSLHRHRLRFPHRRRSRSAHPARPARTPEPGAADAGAVRRAVLDARHHDDLSLCVSGALGLQQLFVSLGSGREGYGVSPPQRLLLLGLSRSRTLHLFQPARRGRAKRRLVQLRPLRAARIQPGSQHRFLCAGNDLPRDFNDGRLGEFRGDLSPHAGARHVVEPRSHFDLGNNDRVRRQSSRRPFRQLGVLSSVDRPPVRNALLSPEQRRPSVALAASLLDVRASLGLRRRSAGDGARFRFPSLLLPQAARRLFRGGDWNSDDHGARFWRLAAPHVRNRHSISRARFFQRRVLRHRHSERNCRVRVGRDDLDGPTGADRGLSLLTPASS